MLNVLNLAIPIIGGVTNGGTFEYRTYVSDSVNDSGVIVPTYSAWTTCEGVVQPQDASIFDFEGTEPAKNAITVWAKIDFKTLDVQEHCDQVRYKSKIYNCERRTNWSGQNGWSTFSCTEDKNATGNEPS